MRIFGFHPSERGFAILGIILLAQLAIGLTLFTIYGSDEESFGFILVPFSALFILVIVASIRVYRRAKDQVLVSTQGLTYVPFLGQPINIPWDKITGVRPHEMYRRYDVLGTQGECVMKLSYELDQFEQLDAILREHLAKRSTDGRMTFISRSVGGKALIAAFCGLLIISFLSLWFNGMNLKVLWGMFLSGGCIVWELYRVRRLVISRDEIIAEYLWWHRTIPFSVIQRVSYGDGYLAGNVLCIDRLHQKPFRVEWASGDAPRLLQAIETAWKQSTAAPSAATTSD